METDLQPAVIYEELATEDDPAKISEKCDKLCAFDWDSFTGAPSPVDISALQMKLPISEEKNKE